MKSSSCSYIHKWIGMMYFMKTPQKGNRMIHSMPIYIQKSNNRMASNILSGDSKFPKNGSSQ